ncbi:MAG: DUF3052 family protein [bacterium]
MGLEALCRASFDGKISKGKAHLETAELQFRGDFSLKIPFKQIESFEAKSGKLRIQFPEGTVIFELGPQAEKWALKIRYPRSVIDKLGVKPGLRVSVLGIQDENFRQQLCDRTEDVFETKVANESDLIFFAADKVNALSKLKTLRCALKKNGGIWVIWPKGQAHIKEDMVRAAALAQGLVDVKVVSFSNTHSGLKLVIPLAKR